ncbi:MAG: hypothetical protein HXY51_02020 [Nitrospirae bacterium]|nr:hypothetical protein [Nitrospirota bacterium]
MTKDQAAELQAKWHQQGDHYCEHLKVEVECSNDGELTGNSYCLACGAAVAS